MNKIFLTFALISLTSLTAFGQADKEYSKTLKTLFQVSGTEESYQVVIKQMFNMFKEQYTQVEEELWDDLEKEFAKTSLKDLTEMLVPVYSKYMTIADLEELIAFYKSPVGMKYAKSTPFIMEESMQIGQQWGQKIGKDFEKKMRERGY